MIGAVASLHPLLARAELCLLARSALTDPSSDHWPNRGTGGRALDGIVVVTPSYLAIDETDDIGDATDVAGPAFYTTASSPVAVSYAARMFDVPANVTGHELDDGDGTESFTITIVFTPLYANPVAVRFFWNYQDDAPGDPKTILSSQFGTVIENVNLILDPDDPTENPPIEGDWLAAAASYDFADIDPGPPIVYNALNVVGNIEDDFPTGRQAITIRVDRGEDLFTVWRNGDVIADPNGYGNMSGIGQVLASTNKVEIGGGHACHAIIWHKRLLDDEEIERLHALFA